MRCVAALAGGGRFDVKYIAGACGDSSLLLARTKSLKREHSFVLPVLCMILAS